MGVQYQEGGAVGEEGDQEEGKEGGGDMLRRKEQSRQSSGAQIPFLANGNTSSWF